MSGLSKEERREQVRLRLRDEGIGWHYSMYHERASLGDLGRVRLFWEGGMKVDEPNGLGQTVLHLAARSGHLNILREAIEIGANPNAVSINKRTPLSEAVLAENEHIVRELINQGAEIDHQVGGGGGCTCLAIAASMGHIGIVRLLVDAGARINSTNSSGASALMLAAFKRSREIVSLLVERGADIRLQDSDGANAMDYALAAADNAETTEVLSAGGLLPTKPRKIPAGSGSSGGCNHVRWRTDRN